MTRKEMVQFVQAYLQREAGVRLNLKESAVALDAVLEAFKTTLAFGNNLQVRGFGTWKVNQYDSRQMKDLKGQPLTVPPHRQISFKSSPQLKQLVNGRDQLAETESVEDQY